MNLVTGKEKNEYNTIVEKIMNDEMKQRYEELLLEHIKKQEEISKETQIGKEKLKKQIFQYVRKVIKKWSNDDCNVITIDDYFGDSEFEIGEEFIRRGFKMKDLIGSSTIYDVWFDDSNFYLEILERNKDLPKVCEKIKRILLKEKRRNQEIEDYAHEVFSEWLFTQKNVKAKAEFAAENINSKYSTINCMYDFMNDQFILNFV
jgi:hypothetical protein